MYESFPIWGQFYSSYLAAGPEKMARQQVGKIDYLVQQNKNKGDEMKQYETDRNYDGDYDSDILKNFEMEIKTIRDEIKKEVDIQNKFSKQSEDIYKKMKRDGKIGIHKSRLYRRPQIRSFKKKMSGGNRLKNKTYKRGVRETMIRNELPEDIGEILFNNLKIQ